MVETDVASLTDDVQVAMTENGMPFFTSTMHWLDLDTDEGRLAGRGEKGDSPLTATAAYKAFNVDSPTEYCTGTIAKTMPPVQAEQLRALRGIAHFNEGQFRLPSGRDCVELFQPMPVVVQVKARRGSRWTTARTADQCYGWIDRDQSGHHFALHPLGGDRQTLLFVPRTPRRNVETFNFRVRAAQATADDEFVLGLKLRSGVFRVRTTYSPPDRCTPGTAEPSTTSTGTTASMGASGCGCTTATHTASGPRSRIVVSS
jgi:hypothetical protein